MADHIRSMNLRGFPPWRVTHTRKEMKDMPCSMNRRAVLAGSTAALATPAFGIKAGATECSYPALARELAGMCERISAQTKRDEKASDQFNKLLFERTGLTPRQMPLPPEKHPEVWHVFNDISKQVERDLVDECGCSIAWTEIHDVLEPLVDKVVRQPMLNTADMALQLQALAAIHPEWGDADSADDSSDNFVRMFLNNLCTFAGIDVMPGVMSLLPVDDDEEQPPEATARNI
jgi:hypothetical protein